MPPLSSGVVPLRIGQDVVICRRLVHHLADDLGFSTVGKTMVVTAASELARNTLIHGGGGELLWEAVFEGSRVGIRLVFQDQGPGIVDLGRAMTDGWSSGGGLGLGLTGAKRLVHEFSLCSVAGAGTRVTIVRWK
jgi:serine/threonine-protein kinase RsbT